jgi:hypothetical protein
LTVQDTIPPVVTLNGSAAMTIECHSSFTDPGATAFDTCAGSLPVTTNGTVNPNQPGTNVLAYTATDPSGNSATNTRTVIVVDTMPPVVTLLGANPLTNECHTAFIDPGATADDTCAGSLSVLTNSTVNPNAVGLYTISYTATDPSGNSTTNTRTVRVVDTTPPSLTCSTNILLECTGAAGTPAFFTTTATDTCDTNVTVVCTPPSGSLFALGTNTVVCVATDASGNSNLCSFTVTVRDTAPPQIVCPTNMNVAEAPRDSGFATVTFPSPIATDLCDSSPSVFSTPPSGSVLPVGTNTITCTAVDSSGNSNSCTFTIRVIPYRLHVTVSSVADSGPGTLRQALQDANDSPDANLVVFNFPGPAPSTCSRLCQQSPAPSSLMAGRSRALAGHRWWNWTAAPPAMRLTAWSSNPAPAPSAGWRCTGLPPPSA